MAYDAGAVVAEVVRGPYAFWYTIDATLGGNPVTGATGLRPTGGSITDTSKAGVRRTLTLEVAAEPGSGLTSSQLYDALSPIGTTLTVTQHIRLPDRTVADIPMGVFDVDSQRMSEGAGVVSLTAPDKWIRVQRAQFLAPETAANPEDTVAQTIVGMLVEALGTQPVIVAASNISTKVGPLTWEKDRAKAIISLASSINAWVYFDRNGVATIADLPQISGSANWTVDAGDAGVMTELDRERSRTDAVNVWVVSSSAADGAKFPTTVVWDDDASSPTFAGYDNGFGRPNPSTAGPFGQVVDYIDDQIIDNAGSAHALGKWKLTQSTGLASQVSLGQVPNPLVDAYDVIDVAPPVELRGTSRLTERNLIETVTHPLTPSGAQSIDGRSTRTGGFSA